MSDNGVDMDIISEQPSQSNQVPAFFMNDDGEAVAIDPNQEDQALNQQNHHRRIWPSHWLGYPKAFDAIWGCMPNAPGAHNRTYAVDSHNMENGLLYRDGHIVGLFVGLIHMSKSGNLCLDSHPKKKLNKKGGKILWAIMGAGLQGNTTWLDYQPVETFMRHNDETKFVYNPIVPGPYENNGRPTCAFMHPTSNKASDHEVSEMISYQIAFLITFDMIIYFYEIGFDGQEKINIPDYLAKIIEEYGADVIHYEAYNNTTNNYTNKRSPLFPVHTLPLKKIIARKEDGTTVYQADAYNAAADTFIINNTTKKFHCKLSSIIVQNFQWARQFIIPNYANEGSDFLPSFMSQVTGVNDSLDLFSGRVIRADYMHLFRGDIRRRIIIGPDRALPNVHEHFLPNIDPEERAEIIQKSIDYWANFYSLNTDPNTEFNENSSFYNSDLRHFIDYCALVNHAQATNIIAE